MVGPEERGKPERFRGLRDRKLVGVTGALLRFNEYPKVHERQTMRASDEYRLEPESVWR